MVRPRDFCSWEMCTECCEVNRYKNDGVTSQEVYQKTLRSKETPSQAHHGKDSQTLTNDRYQGLGTG